MDYPWYSFVPKSRDLQQGDFIQGMNVPIVKYNSGQALAKSPPTIEWTNANWIMLTQSCDLNPDNNDKKKKKSKVVKYAVVCPVYKIGDLSVNNDAKTNILRNRDYKYHGLPAADHPVSGDDFMVVDFREARYAKLSVIKTYAFARGNGSRLRLNSPYVENMSSRFGSTFSRIANQIDFPTKDDIARL
jgi:hypothetical protein